MSLPPPTDAEASRREARERFAAGYIRCVHDVHTFVSTCPGVDPALAAELLHHLMESMPLKDAGGREGGSAPRGAPSSTDPPYSDLDETESGQNHLSSLGEAESQELSFTSGPPWRPW